MAQQTKRKDLKWIHAGAVRFQRNPRVIHEIFFAFSSPTAHGIQRLTITIDKPGAFFTGSGCTATSLLDGITWDEHLWKHWEGRVEKKTGEWTRAVSLAQGNEYRRDALKSIYDDANFVDPWTMEAGKKKIGANRFVAVCMDNGYPLHGNGMGNCPESWKHQDSAREEVKEEVEEEIKQKVKEMIEEKIKVEDES
ncbi:hypothetical protein DL95DRAFT_457165 [Leptodontidium sp. 2 PMI_412]|nr:hypothetical protein DL95DRAFT_457165 [Leptodontidium sp. 2 PMI_412]